MTSQNYGFHLAEYLAISDKLSVWKPLVYVINAKHIKDFKRAFPERDKTDLIDSQFITEYLRFRKLPHLFEANNRYLPLQRLVRYRYHLVKNTKRETNKAIEKEMKGFSNPLLSVKGLGPVYAAGIFACIGTVSYTHLTLPTN